MYPLLGAFVGEMQKAEEELDAFSVPADSTFKYSLKAIFPQAGATFGLGA